MSNLSTTAMVLAAGMGSRLRPLTLDMPKPLIEVGGRAMIDHALDRLVEVGIQRAVVNTFYLADLMENHLSNRSDIEIIISRESELLDTGGGVKHAIDHFDHQPFFCLNADLPWMDGERKSLPRMMSTWNDARMDALLLVMRADKARGFSTSGDFELHPDGHLFRKNLAVPRPYVMISAQIVKPELYSIMPAKVFSNRLIWDRAEDQKTLFGVEHEGTCFHVGTPKDWKEANELLADGSGWAVE